MTYFAALLIVALSIVAAAVASMAVAKVLSVDSRRRQHEVGIAVFTQLGVMIAVLLAFVFNQVWGDYRTVALAINGECGALHGAAMLASALPDGEGAPLIRAIETYAQTVVKSEWPMMAERRRSPQAAHQLEEALRLAANLNVSRPPEVSTQGQILNLLAQAHAYRETRTFQFARGIPPMMWFIIIALSALLTIFVVFAGVESPGHIVLSGVFAAAMALVLVLVRMLDFPFEGALALRNVDFLKLLGEVSVLARGGGA